MTAASFVLFCVALCMAIEAGWAMIRPAAFREQVRTLLASPDLPPSAGVATYWTLALAMWAVAIWGHAWIHRALFFVGVLLAFVGWVCTRPSWIMIWFNLWLGHRSDRAIRGLYFIEALIALGLIWLSFTGR